MTQPLSFGRIDLSAGAGPESAGAVPLPGAPFRVLLLADWSGRGGTRPGQPLLQRAPVAVDRDNFDDVLAASEVEVPVPLTKEGSARVPLRVGALDDFHPDQVIQRVQVFQALRTLRNRLKNPSTFAAAAEEMRGWVPASAAGVAPPQPAPRPAAVNPHNLLAEILGEEPSAPAPPAAPAQAVDWDSYLRQVFEPYLLPRVDYSQQAQLLALVEDVMSKHLRAILHAPEFQAAEAAWRGLSFLVRRLETGSRLKPRRPGRRLPSAPGRTAVAVRAVSGPPEVGPAVETAA